MAVSRHRNVVLLPVEGDAIADEWFFIKSIFWLNPTTAGHLVQITDTAGENQINMTCDAQYKDQKRTVGEWWNGVKLPDLDSGSVEVHVNG